MTKTPSASRAVNVSRAIAWPVCVALCIISFWFLFRQPISVVISRLKKGDFVISKGGIRLDFQQDLSYQVAQVDDLQSDIKSIIDQAAQSKDKAVVLAWNLLNRKLRRIMAESNWNNGVPMDAMTSINILVNLGVIAKSSPGGLQSVQIERDRIVERQEPDKDNSPEPAIISAIYTLRMLYAVQVGQEIVEYSNLNMYADSECKEQIPGITGVMLKQTLVEGLGNATHMVYPTTRTDYEKREHVSWKWTFARIVGDAWYRDPTTNEIKKAWSWSAIFVGGNIDNID